MCSLLIRNFGQRFTLSKCTACFLQRLKRSGFVLNNSEAKTKVNFFVIEPALSELDDGRTKKDRNSRQDLKNPDSLSVQKWYQITENYPTFTEVFCKKAKYLRVIARICSSMNKKGSKIIFTKINM